MRHSGKSKSKCFDNLHKDLEHVTFRTTLGAARQIFDLHSKMIMPLPTLNPRAIDGFGHRADLSADTRHHPRSSVPGSTEFNEAAKFARDPNLGDFGQKRPESGFSQTEGNLGAFCIIHQVLGHSTIRYGI
jgi:hypothetical protein